jgi:hypothetical protein
MIDIEEAQQLADVQKRPSHLARYPGPGAPLRPIIAEGHLGPIGRWVLLECRHWREIIHYDLLPVEGKKKPVRERCGLCRDGITCPPSQNKSDFL